MAPRKKASAAVSDATDASAPTGTPLAAAVPAVIANELPTPVALKDFRVVSFEPKDIAEVMAENFGGERLDRFALTHIKIPSGGGLAWTVPTLEGPKPMEFVEGVILAHQLQRAYWSTSFDETGGGSPPDCSSVDAETGVGDPGGACGRCPFAEFGSATDDKGEQGAGQACRMVRVVYVLRPGSLVPSVIPLPPSSLKVMRSYLMQLAEAGLGVSGVVTRFALAQDKNGKGIVYSKVKPTVLATLTKEESTTWIAPIKKIVQGLTMTIDVRDYQSE